MNRAPSRSRLCCAILTLLAALLCLSVRAADTPAATPAAFRVTSTFPKYVTADIEFRDPTGAKWPSFFYGKPATEAGYIRLGPGQPAAGFALLCDKMAQDRGDQSRKVLGELCPPEKQPAVTLTITAMGALQGPPAGSKDKAVQATELTGLLDIGGRRIPVKLATTLRHHSGKGDEKNIALMLDGRGTLKASDLGLKALAPTAPVEVRLGLTAYPPQTATSTKK